jgi:7,8-dihydropterin-6-yl-methyl-4-(beta-D-ribofuranosyl)aminobenzene 5'-phosphate synthase
VHVAGKGLVIVSGCSHAGAVDVLRNARRLTGRKATHLLARDLPEGFVQPSVGRC